MLLPYDGELPVTRGDEELRNVPLFTVLGPLQVRSGDTVSEPAGKPAALLALLLLHANSWVSADQIVDALWESGAPASAGQNVKTYIWQLRRTLPDGASRVDGRRGGYRIRVAPGELDAAVLAELAGSDIEDPHQLRAALALWRGDPYPELPAELTRIAAARLEQLRFAVQDRLAGVLIEQGRFLDAVALLRPLLAENPLREGLWVRLIAALHGAGQRSEALAAYQLARRTLLDQLGVEPGTALQAAQRRVLSGAAPANSARCFLPRDVPDFRGRETELAELLATSPNVAVIEGMPGIGKTTLALHAAHRLTGQFPDGQFFCRLRGQDPVPSAPGELLGAALRAFGVAAIPSDVEERAALWRSTLAGRRVLLVLDDAADAAQLAPLLPGGGDCLVLVTSRRRLSEPDGARVITLGPLPERAAVELFAAGDRRVLNDPAAAEVVRRCAGLPIAIRLAAARLRQRPAWTAGTLAQRLATAAAPLAEFRSPDRDLASVFGTSYQRLSPEAQRLFRLLGTARDREFDLAAIAELAGLPSRAVESTVERLVDEHLVTERTPGWFELHELLRTYARELAPVPAARLVGRGRAVPVAARTA